MRASLALAVLALLAPALAGCLGRPDGPVGPLRGDAVSFSPATGAVVIDGSVERAWEPTVAVDPGNPLHIVAASIASGSGGPGIGAYGPLIRAYGNARVHVSLDGGVSWRTVRVPAGLEAGLADPPTARAGWGGDPALAFMPDGALLYAGLGGSLGDRYSQLPAQAGTGGSLFVARSTDGGFTFPEVSVVAQGEGIGAAAPAAGLQPTTVLWREQDKEWMAVGPDGTLLMAWTEMVRLSPPNLSPDFRCDMRFSTSKDGRSWTPPGTVEQGGCFNFGFPAVQADGTWHVAYYDVNDWRMRVATSRNEGATWSVHQVVEPASHPNLRVQPRPDGERLLLSYSAFVGDPPPFESLEEAVLAPSLIWSDDGGATWSAPLVLDRPDGPGGGSPTLDVAADGTAYVTFFHARAEAEARGPELRAVALRDGRWSPPVVLDANIEGPASNLGHYMGLAAAPGGAFAVWVNHREGEYDVVGATLRLGSEVG